MLSIYIPEHLVFVHRIPIQVRRIFPASEILVSNFIGGKVPDGLPGRFNILFGRDISNIAVFDGVTVRSCF